MTAPEGNSQFVYARRHAKAKSCILFVDLSSAKAASRRPTVLCCTLCCFQGAPVTPSTPLSRPSTSPLRAADPSLRGDSGGDGVEDLDSQRQLLAFCEGTVGAAGRVVLGDPCARSVCGGFWSRSFVGGNS